MPKTEKLNIDPRMVHATIAIKLRELANQFDQLADPTASREITDVGFTSDEVAKAKAKPVDAEEIVDAAPKASAKKATKAKPAPAPEEVETQPETQPEMTPEQIAADLKAKLVALVGKDRAKAVAILGTVGAKNFSTIPVDKHAQALRKVNEALNPKPDDDDPLA